MRDDNYVHNYVRYMCYHTGQQAMHTNTDTNDKRVETIILIRRPFKVLSIFCSSHELTQEVVAAEDDECYGVV